MVDLRHHTSPCSATGRFRPFPKQGQQLRLRMDAEQSEGRRQVIANGVLANKEVAGNGGDRGTTVASQQPDKDFPLAARKLRKLGQLFCARH